jgi:preprotein translocase SecE subunit
MAAGTKQIAKSGKKQQSPGGLQAVAEWPARARAYIEEIRREMRLVTWPTRDVVRSSTFVVLVTVFFFGVYFGVVDYILTLWQTWMYQRFAG